MIPWFRDFYKVMQESGLDLRWTALAVVEPILLLPGR